MKGSHAAISKPYIKQSSFIARVNLCRSSGDSAEERNTKDIVMSSGKTKNIIIASDGAMTLGTNLQSCIWISPSAKKAVTMSISVKK